MGLKLLWCFSDVKNCEEWNSERWNAPQTSSDVKTSRLGLFSKLIFIVNTLQACMHAKKVDSNGLTFPISSTGQFDEACFFFVESGSHHIF